MVHQGKEVKEMMKLMNDPTVSQESFGVIVSSWLTTHSYLFQQIFGDAFIYWLEWMRLEDIERFKQVLQNAIISESQEHVRILTTCIIPDETTPFALQMIQDRINSCKIKEFFIDPPFFEHRVYMLLDWASQSSQRWNANKIGWCPLSKLIYSEYFPFSLPQLARSSILHDSTRAFKSNKSVMLKMNSVATFEWIRTLLPEVCNPDLNLVIASMGDFYAGNERVPIIQDTFIPELLQKYIYHKDIELLKQDRITFIHFECICARIVNKLMQLYLDTVFRQLYDPLYINGKQQIWNLVETQILEFMNQ